MTNHVFVLSYCGAQEFFDSIDTSKFSNTKFYFIDNGQQQYSTNNLECFTYTTSKNLGCAGGWNLICDIAFSSLNLEKIIITQDDATFTEEQLEDALAETNSNCLTGVYQPYFEFSCFALHKDIWKTVGRFDENFIYVYSEDADYKQRCMLSNIIVSSLMIPSKDSNKSLTIAKNPDMNRILYNREYLRFKWGDSIHPSQHARNDMQAPFEYKLPFKDRSIDYIPISPRIRKIYYANTPSELISQFPSEEEYDIFNRKIIENAIN
jgi:hypothetical protein